jgi:hypothetical protein
MDDPKRFIQLVFFEKIPFLVARYILIRDIVISLIFGTENIAFKEVERMKLDES